MPAIESITAEVSELPLRHNFATARDRLARMVTRPVVIALRLDDGREFFGESTPVEYVTGETQESVLSAIAHARPRLEAMDVSRLKPGLDRLRSILPDSPSARAGVEIALYNAHAGITGISLWSQFGGGVTSVETDITLSISDDAVERAIEAANRGFRVFKMKVGGDQEADIRRVLAVNQAVPGARFRLDGNQGFNAEGTLKFIDNVLEAGVKLELVEQPVPKEDLESLDRVAVDSPVPVFADEAVKSAADALRLVRETRVQGINVKLMKSGISGALDIIAIARAAGVSLMIGCMLESRRGISFSLALACGTGAFDYVDLDSHLLIREEGENMYFDQSGPVLSIRTS